MKRITEKKLEHINTKIFSRVVIDRKAKKNTAILEHKRQIIKEVNVSAAYLYDYYISICQIPVWDLTDDESVAKQCGLTKRQVGENRRKLTDAGWIRFDTFVHKGRKYGTWFIGKDVVAMKMTEDTNLAEFNEVGIITDDEYEHLTLKVDQTNVVEIENDM